MGDKKVNTCKYCNVYVDSNLIRCPLCLRVISKDTAISDSLYPEYNMNEDAHKSHSKRRLFLFLSISISGLCFLLNLLTWSGQPWSLYIIVSILYAWILVGNTILSKSHTGVRILLQLVGISFVVLIFDIISGNLNWALNFVIPLLTIAAILLITINVHVKRMLWREYLLYQFIMILIGLVPIVLFLFGVIDVLWPSAAAVFSAVITFISMMIFSDKEFKNELAKRFHI